MLPPGSFIADWMSCRASGQFDVTLFNGIFYPLPDPVILSIAAHHMRELMVVNTKGRARTCGSLK